MYVVAIVDLPVILPVFSVPSTILMPHAHLPVVTRKDAFLGISSEVIENNIIAIVQPRPLVNYMPSDISPSFKAGCAGRITEVNFRSDEVTIDILGLCRFEIIDELQPDITGIVRVLVSYDKFKIDMEDSTLYDDDATKERLVNALSTYLQSIGISPSWPDIKMVPLDVLVSAVTMTCPFLPSEKQSLMELVDIKARSDLMTIIMEMNARDLHNTANIIN